MAIKLRFNQNVAQVPVPICDACFEGFHTDCEGGNCACQWTHTGEDWEETTRKEKAKHDQ